MPLSTVLGAQSLIKPGVCTSSTRPASPYDGQMIYETDTDKTLVWNGTAWVNPNAMNSAVWLNTQNGYGSSSTAIYRYTNVVSNNGTSITYADSATLGSTFTINTAGMYSMSMWFNVGSGGGEVAFSLNSTQLTTRALSITVSTRLGLAYTGAADNIVSCSTTGYFAVNDVIRPVGNPGVTPFDASRCGLTIAQVA